MTRRWSLISLIVALSVALAFVLVDIGNGAAAGDPAAKLKGVGWWPMHEKTGTVAADASGHHAAELKGGASWSEGPHGGAVRFDGFTGFVDTGAPIVNATAKDYSVAAWVQLEDVDKICTMVSQDGDATSVFSLQYFNGKFTFGTNGFRAVDNDGTPQPGRWYHLVGTYSHADSMLRVFVDGFPAGSSQAHVPAVTAGNLVIGRGRFNGQPADFCKLAIADVHVFGRALTTSEVGALTAHEPR